MQNEFEKQIQKKMEELNFTPSEPVWKNIESQIRPEKDRRILYIWLPLLVAGLVGGFLWLNNGALVYKHSISNKDGKYYSKITTNSAHPVKIKQITKPIKEDNILSKNNSNEPIRSTSDNESMESVSANKISSNLKTSEHSKKLNVNLNNYLENTSLSNESKKLFKKKIEPFTSTNNNSTIVNKGLEIQNSTTVSNRKNYTLNYLPDDHLLPASVLTFQSVPFISSLKFPWSTESKKDSLADIVSIQDKNDYRWKLGLATTTGYSGSKENTDYSKSNYYPSSSSNQPPPFQASYIPLVNKGISFSIGFSIQKKISKKILFSTGIQYNYYSTSNIVGQKVIQDTTINKSMVNSYYQDVSFSLYNSQGQPSQIIETKYRNQFHHLSIPVALDFQLMNTVPLFIHASVSVHQLIYTNALLSNGLIYYHDKSAFTKTQIFSEGGINYAFSLKNKLTLLAGPQIEYSLSANDNITSNHLYSIGLGAHIYFSSAKK
ncbi:MAG: hypothetical protein ACJ748_07015 [Flavisolibacter sp.]